MLENFVNARKTVICGRNFVDCREINKAIGTDSSNKLQGYKK